LAGLPVRVIDPRGDAGRRPGAAVLGATFTRSRGFVDLYDTTVLL